MPILLASFSKEELLDYDLTQDVINTFLKVPLGEDGFREIDITINYGTHSPVWTF